ncbi:GntR family transcriptional regulator [Actibacterium sp. 188UL27-1]|uniref:GntR family transcriptional regulator n=1 Tax=Actibacterium sp. 188UL27-1 TaxID=2786961 RepID=UPI00195C1BFD|nr:GntR family transcriptional regulator [Actibacterium sp. 188UL27-1]
MTVTTPKKTLVSEAHARLKSEILSNRMPQGFQATEPEVAMRLGMSRTPVREALILLQTEGLVELVPRRGVRVLPISPDDMREIYDILTALEPEAAAMLAAQRPTEAELAPLSDATSDMEQALDRNDLEVWAEADDRFHRILIQMSGNNRLLAIVGTLNDQAHRARIATLGRRDKPVASTRDHRDILNCLATGDADRTREAFRTHRQRAAHELVEILSNSSATAG